VDRSPYGLLDTLVLVALSREGTSDRRQRFLDERL